MKSLSSSCRDLIALNLIDGMGALSIKKLVEHLGDTEKIFSLKTGEIREITGVSSPVAEKVRGSRGSDEYKKEIRYIENENINVLCFCDEDYPRSLRNIYDPPAVLYYKGTMPGQDDIFVAVVGARQCSLYGMTAAEQLSAGMAECGVTIVSGMAKGIDSAAHRGTLRSSGKTVAVMGTGFKHIYPKGSEKLVTEICQRGAVITEFPCDTIPAKFTFPRRNRIISGMSRGVLVVEAAKRSGALITVDFALEQGKDVFAVPGQVGSVTSFGTNSLIQNGAKLVLSVRDILDEVAPDISPSRCKEGKDLLGKNEVMVPEDAAGKIAENMSLDQKNVFEVIPGGERVSIDEIGVLSGVGVGSIHSVLLFLELKGMVRSLPGAMYERAAH